MTATEIIPTIRPYEPVTFNSYRDVHKGIRAELFAVTGDAGRVDPADGPGRVALAGYVSSIVTFLVDHAEHEDAHVQPLLETHLPDLAARIAGDHERIEARLVGLRELGNEVAEQKGPAARAGVDHLYLELASFTAVYLEHQDFEERAVMPALESAVGVPGVMQMHGELVGSIPPDEMAKSLAVMIPAMNIDDRTELLGGLRANAPAEVFQGVWSLVGSVLPSSDVAPLAQRLGIS